MKIFNRFFRGTAAVALTLTAAFLPGFGAAEEMPEFTVICDLNGNHGNDPDRISHERERALLTEALVRAYPRLSPELQEVAGKTAFVINHSHAEITKVYSGWSAEDDAHFYKYPDTKFYNPKKYGSDFGPDGTIRVNFTEKFILGLDLGDRLGADSPFIKRGAVDSYGAMLVGHEVEHAYQWHTGPVRSNVSQHPEMVEDGLVDKGLLKDLARKIEYEHEALAVHRQYVEPDPLMAFAEAAKAFEQDHPEMFVAGGRYYLLSVNRPNSFTGRYLAETARTADQGGKFDSAGRVIYYGQIEPPRIVHDLKELNDDIEAGQISSTADTDGKIMKLRMEWNSYSLEDPALWQKSKDALPYLQQVENRYNRELVRFEKLTAPK
ncbi:MAG: hypothetical protein HY370_07735 [Proteobacteria bacterium]|nr:hypothetical protein [Pseudomonadota bacterium]